LRYTRWWFVSLYFYSGLSKLDASFCQELGNLFLTTALRPTGLDPAGWPATWRIAAILAMPVGELAVAAALLVPRTRRLGLAAALVLHAALLGILGPWGLDHSTIVLVWNAAMMAEVAILFGPKEPAPSPANTSSENAGWLGVLARLVFWAGVVLPLGERWGWLDTWPSHALYASHAERTDVFVLDEQGDELAPELRAHFGPPGFDGWRRLDLTAWSRAVRGVPVYPQGRACNGLAEAIAARYRGRVLIKVVQWSRAELWTGRRARVECLGGEAIRRYGARFSVNAHPARSRPEQLSPHRGVAANRPQQRRRDTLPCGSPEQVEFCSIPPRCQAGTGSATWVRKRMPSSGSLPIAASAGGRSSRSVPPGSATPRTSPTRPTPGTRS
jgi:hypothetical protein